MTKGGLRGGKATTYESGFRVPCVMKWDGHIQAGSTCSELVTAMDIMPTPAGLVGGHMPNDRVIDGKNVMPLITGRLGAKTSHDAFYYYQGKKPEAVRCGKWK